MRGKQPDSREEVIDLVTSILLNTHRPRVYLLDEIIHILRPPNFSTLSFQEQYALIDSGMTAHAFFEKGGRVEYLRHFEAAGILSVDIPF